MSSKTGFTMAQHTQVGEYLRQAKSDFPRILVGVSRHYPNTVGRSGKVIDRLRRIDKELSTICNELEELMASEHPKEWTVDVYYGARDPKLELAVIAGEADADKLFAPSIA